ncbi:hypothetical protein E2562_033540 [Oryza meyeriana var. granulata]|uniref:Uncharacterized protein n=1 Tax=Oryza meyeriana var. granulata TaxID=110450 RepID=A0A6G1ES55_9ORYZ|nr:hypothetical protein E2562_033540 [Oryza meyeriana var. granulata]
MAAALALTGAGDPRYARQPTPLLAPKPRPRPSPLPLLAGGRRRRCLPEVADADAEPPHPRGRGGGAGPHRSRRSALRPPADAVVACRCRSMLLRRPMPLSLLPKAAPLLVRGASREGAGGPRGRGAPEKDPGVGGQGAPKDPSRVTGSCPAARWGTW